MAIAITKYLSSDGRGFDTEAEADQWDRTRTMIHRTRTIIQKIDEDLDEGSSGVEILAWIEANFQLLKEYFNAQIYPS